MFPRALLFVVLGLSSLGVISCTKSVAPAAPHYLRQHLGEQCTVEYRRDALGSGGPIAIPPTTDEFNGSVVSQHGKLIAVEGEGLVIEGATPGAGTGTPTPASYWIPYHAILTVIFKSEK